MDLAEKYKIKVVAVDVDRQPLIKGQYTAFATPTVLLIKENKEILRESKFIDFEKIERTLKLTSE